MTTVGSPGGDVGSATRRVAIELLVRIERDTAYANLVVPRALDRSDLSDRDRRFVTELVYGTTRMRRACDWLVDRFVMRRLDPPTRAALRVGAYQLVHLGVAPHAAVDATVGAAPRRSRGLVNAVLRRVADASTDWPDVGTELSYPDWIVQRLESDLGGEDARAALVCMNRSPEVTTRADGYVQDRASQWVVDALEVGPADVVVDLCAGPGGKATGIGHRASLVVATDLHPQRAATVAHNANETATDQVVRVVAADGRQPPLRDGRASIALVDAPCSGLGVLRRRPDARWRIEPDAVERLQRLQSELLDAAIDLVGNSGILAYSVCTMTTAETIDVAEAFQARNERATSIPPPAGWRKWGPGGLLLPQDHDTDGMALFLWRVGD